eukprot:gene22341-29430_t
MIGTPKKTFANSNALLYRALILIGLLVAFLTGGFFFMGVSFRAYEQSIASPNSPFNFGFCPQQSSSVMVQADGRSAMPASTTTAGVSTAGAGSTGKVTIKVKVSGPGIAKKSMDPICTNTCNKSKNGVCDDGREAGQHNNPGQNFMFVFCDLGTDCNDCGPWQPDVPVTWGQGGEGPIAVLIKKGVEVRVKNTTTPTPYRFAYTDPAHDVDVSAGMDGNGMFETVLTKNRCIQDKGKRSLFVDVGANFGWYSALASSMGCRVDAFEPVPHFRAFLEVDAFEPVPHFRAFLEYNLHVNNFSPLVTVHACVISNETGKDMEMKVPKQVRYANGMAYSSANGYHMHACCYRQEAGKDMAMQVPKGALCFGMVAVGSSPFSLFGIAPMVTDTAVSPNEKLARNGDESAQQGAIAIGYGSVGKVP